MFPNSQQSPLPFSFLFFKRLILPEVSQTCKSPLTRSSTTVTLDLSDGTYARNSPNRPHSSASCSRWHQSVAGSQVSNRAIEVLRYVGIRINLIHSIVFVHGLWGHPLRSWEATTHVRRAVDTSSPQEENDRRSSSVFKPKSWGRSKSGPVSPEKTTPDGDSLQRKVSRSFVPTIFTVKPGRSRPVEPNRVCWPRDLLPLDIPTANI